MTKSRKQKTPRQKGMGSPPAAAAAAAKGLKKKPR